jgi:hypothetical protein
LNPYSLDGIIRKKEEVSCGQIRKNILIFQRLFRDV